jgi:hypothetical protein
MVVGFVKKWRHVSFMPTAVVAMPCQIRPR